jgi:hypothetical protein
VFASPVMATQAIPLNRPKFGFGFQFIQKPVERAQQEFGANRFVDGLIIAVVGPVL